MVNSLTFASIGNHSDYESKDPARLSSLGRGAQPFPMLHHLFVLSPAQASWAICKHLSLHKQTQKDVQWTLFRVTVAYVSNIF